MKPKAGTRKEEFAKGASSVKKDVHANNHRVSLGAAAASIDAAAATNVYLYGESTANKAKHANVTLVGGALTVDASLV